MREATRARAALVVLLLVSVVLVLLDVRDGGAIGSVRGFTAAVVGPVERAAGAVASPFVHLAHSILGFSDAEVLESQVSANRDAIADSPEVKALNAAEQEQLASLLRASSISGHRIVPGRVVAYSTWQRFGWSVTIDVGTSSGLDVDMAVITGDGLVGRIVSVGPNTATVKLIADPESAVAARMESSLQAGSLHGNGSPNEAVLQLLDTTAAVNVGDRVVTFGSVGGRPYPPGIPLGTVVDFRGEQGQADRVAIVRPGANLSALDIVGVIASASAEDGRSAILPPKPSPSPTTSPSAKKAGSGGAR